MTILSLAELLDKAIIIATVAHKGQTDKGGNPYILHPMAVASRVKTIKQKIVAWLHDVPEDTSVTIEELRKEGFHEDILEALISLTRRSDETYSEFCQRASENELGIEVKIADIKENLDFSRLTNPTKEEIASFYSRSARYQNALRFLYKKKIDRKKTEFKSGIAIAPAETLKEMLEDREITLNDLKLATGLPLHLLERIMRAEVKITEFISEKLGNFFHTDLDFFLKLEKTYQETIQRLKEEEKLNG